MTARAKRISLTEEDRLQMEREYVAEMAEDAEREGSGQW